jgi:hypothetical protein
MSSPNPFNYLLPITNPADFFNRENLKEELKMLLAKGSSCQIIAARSGYGKTSLLRCLGGFAQEWDSSYVTAYLDMNEADCRTIAGFVKAAEDGWGDRTRTAKYKDPRNIETLLSVPQLADRVQQLRKSGKRPVLLLDNFEAVARFPTEFNMDFYLDLRHIAGIGLSFVATSEQPIQEVVYPRNLKVSPFSNIFRTTYLFRFNEEDSHDFVALERPGVPKFTEEEKQAILEFAKDHPMRLQIACHFVLEAKLNGTSLTTGILKAMAAADSRHAA